MNINTLFGYFILVPHLKENFINIGMLRTYIIFIYILIYKCFSNVLLIIKYVYVLNNCKINKHVCKNIL